MVEARQCLFDEIGIKGLFTGTGSTATEAGAPEVSQVVREFLARTLALEDIKGCVVLDLELGGRSP